MVDETEKATGGCALTWKDGQSLDLSPGLPFTIGDWRIMKAKHGIDVMKMATNGLDLDQVVNLIHHACNKVQKGFPLSRVEELYLGDQQIKGTLDAISGLPVADPSG